MFGTDDKTSLPTISFGYTGFDPAAQQVASVTNPPAFSLEDPGVRLIDFDGDGLVDVMQTTPTEYDYWRNNGDGSWGAPLSGAPISDQPIVFSDTHVRLADVNGDRLIDLVYVRAGAI